MSGDVYLNMFLLTIRKTSSDIRDQRSAISDPTSQIRDEHMSRDPHKVPLFRTWTAWYVFVLAFLVVLILLFYWLTKTFA